MTVHITSDEAADALLDRDPFALLVGMLLDQQMPIERAFLGPYKLTQRMGVERLDPEHVAGHDPEEFAAMCSRPPAVHRFPGSMAGRIQALAAHVRDEYDGDTAALWVTASSGEQLYQRLAALPGYGDQKARIFEAFLGKQRDVQPSGWREACEPYGEDGATRSVADVVDPASLLQVRSFKKSMRSGATP
jgi:uncharacterized HhH-GPD family protein